MNLEKIEIAHDKLRFLDTDQAKRILSAIVAEPGINQMGIVIRTRRAQSTVSLAASSLCKYGLIEIVNIDGGTYYYPVNTELLRINHITKKLADISNVGAIRTAEDLEHEAAMLREIVAA